MRKKARHLFRGAGATTVKTWDDACLALFRKGKSAEKGEIGKNKNQNSYPFLSGTAAAGLGAPCITTTGEPGPIL